MLDIVKQMREKWLERATGIQLPAKGAKRTDACINYLAGACQLAELTGQKEAVDKLLSVLFMLQFSGAECFEKEKEDA